MFTENGLYLVGKVQSSRQAKSNPEYEDRPWFFDVSVGGIAALSVRVPEGAYQDGGFARVKPGEQVVVNVEARSFGGSKDISFIGYRVEPVEGWSADALARDGAKFTPASPAKVS